MYDALFAKELEANLSPSAFPALVLNADFRPMSFEPLSTMRWKKALENVLNDQLIVVTEYSKTLRSPSMEIRMPAVVLTKKFVDLNKPAPYSRWNIFLRDDFRCQYCGKPGRSDELTFDHVVPRACGGKGGWLNIATACQGCNAKKAARTPKEAGMKLCKALYQPTLFELNKRMKGRVKMRKVPSEWSDFVSSLSDEYWDTPLET